MVTTSPEDGIPKPSSPAAVALEAWAQGFMVGSLVMLAAITVANMRSGVLLHKLVLIELILGIPHGFFIFFDPPVYNWYLSVTAISLNISWSLHNFISWMKIKPFLSRRSSLIFIGTIILVQPYWVLEIYANFAYFHNINNLFVYTRPYEALFRDPWWVFTTVNLFWNIKYRYEFGFLELTRISPRFMIMLVSMCISLIFTVLDVLSVTNVIQLGSTDGINPFWKLSFVFKCLTDTIILDDFKTALDRLHRYKFDRLHASTGGTTGASYRIGSGDATGPCHTDNLTSTTSADARYKSWQEMSRTRPATTGRDCDEEEPPLALPRPVVLEGIHIQTDTQVSNANVDEVLPSTTSTWRIVGGDIE